MSITKLTECDNTELLMQKVFLAHSFTSIGESGNYGCEVNDARFFVKLAQYLRARGKEESSIENEIEIMCAIKTQVIDRGLTPHFVEILAFTRCEGLEKRIKDKLNCTKELYGHTARSPYAQSLFCAFLANVEAGTGFDKFALVFSEYCDFKLQDYLTRFAPVWEPIRERLVMSFVFQIYYSLAAIRSVLPMFRHNDLYLHNIMIKVAYDPKLIDRQHYASYEYQGQVWNVPFANIILKIIDFGNAELHAEKKGWDHFAFIISFEQLVAELQLATRNEAANFLFKALNPERATTLAARSIIQRCGERSIPPEKVLSENYFKTFSVNVPDELIIHKYRIS